MQEGIQTRPILGKGIYTLPDMATILRIPYWKINRWTNSFLDDRIGKKYNYSYTWNVDLTKAVNFFSLIEIHTFFELSQAGVKSREILQAHDILSKEYHTFYPFANSLVLNKIKTDGKKVLFEQSNGSVFTIDASRQFKLGFIKEFFKNLDFNTDSLAIRLWPMGKDKSIVCDPGHQFGQPVIYGTNIQAQTIYRMYKAEETPEFIASVYNISVQNVIDAIEYFQSAA